VPDRLSCCCTVTLARTRPGMRLRPGSPSTMLSWRPTYAATASRLSRRYGRRQPRRPMGGAPRACGSPRHGRGLPRRIGHQPRPRRRRPRRRATRCLPSLASRVRRRRPRHPRQSSRHLGSLARPAATEPHHKYRSASLTCRPGNSQETTASMVFFSALGCAGVRGAFSRACSSLAPMSCSCLRLSPARTFGNQSCSSSSM
jgi:hypothetical protein